MKPTIPPVVVLPVDPTLARYDNISLFPEKVAKAKAMLTKTNLAKLDELLAQSRPEPA